VTTSARFRCSRSCGRLSFYRYRGALAATPAACDFLKAIGPSCTHSRDNSYLKAGDVMRQEEDRIPEVILSTWIQLSMILTLASASVSLHESAFSSRSPRVIQPSSFRVTLTPRRRRRHRRRISIAESARTCDDDVDDDDDDDDTACGCRPRRSRKQKVSANQPASKKLEELPT